MACESESKEDDTQCSDDDQNITCDVSPGKLSETTEKNQAEKGVFSRKALKKKIGREKWLEHRKRKRVEEKHRKKAKRIALKEAGLGQSLRRFRGKLMEESSCKIRVAIDMSFDKFMSEKDRRRTVQQLNWCYSANRRLAEPLQFYITSFDNECRKIYDSIESNQNQDIFLNTDSLDDLFQTSEIVYLTADSENVLTKLEESKVYVIGGLVDHNSEKGLCYQLAIRNGYEHARLPIDEFVEMKTRKVLTINHVFEILAHFSNHGDWEKAFFAVIPPRKGMSKKTEIKCDAKMSETTSKSVSDVEAEEHSTPVKRHCGDANEKI